MSVNTIPQILNYWSQKAPQSMAIAAPNRPPLSYGTLLRCSRQIIAQLNRLGISRQDRVAVALPNGPEMAVAFLAIASGATCAPLNPNYREPEYEFYLSDLDAKALVVQPGVAESARIVAHAKGIPILELLPQADQAAGSFTLEGVDQADATDAIWAEPQDVALILHTSGTTSRPKMVPLTHQNLWVSARNIAETLALGTGDRCLNVMPLFHIHGLMGCLLSSLTAGASVVCTPGFQAPQFLAWLHDHQPTWYSAVPTMHQQILSRAVEANRVPTSLRLIRSSSAPLPPQIMTELEQVFDAPVIESYGMTEAAHQMASNPLPPQPRKPGSVGIAAGPQVQIMDDQGNRLPKGTVGEVVIQGESVTRGYDNNPEANGTAFVNGWFRTGDLGYFDSDGYLFLKGRIKEIINRGGEKISPREIDEVLLAHPAIDQVVTFAVPHPLLGEEVGVAVVLKPDRAVTEQIIQEFAAQRLADFKIPRVVVFLDEIPKGPTGKRQRIGLAQKLGLAFPEQPTENRTSYVAPQTPQEETLGQIWSDILGVAPIGVEDNFFQLGGDSVLAAQTISRIRGAFHVELPFLDFFHHPTIADMAVLITRMQLELMGADDMGQLLATVEALDV